MPPFGGEFVGGKHIVPRLACSPVGAERMGGSHDGHRISGYMVTQWVNLHHVLVTVGNRDPNVVESPFPCALRPFMLTRTTYRRASSGQSPRHRSRRPITCPTGP